VTVDDKGRYITVHVVAEPSEATKAVQAAQAAEAEQAAELAAQAAADESAAAPQGVSVLRS
jgi:hypothetical protein